VTALADTEPAGGIDRVVVINDDAVASGGAAAIAVASARLLRGRGVPVAFLSGEAAGTAALAREGIEVGVLGGRHLLDGSRGKAAIRGLHDGATAAALSQWIAAHDTPGTLYHLHNWHKALSPSVFLPLRQVAPRLVLSAHDYFLACPNGAYFVYPQQRPCDLSAGGIRCLATACDRRHYGHKLWRFARHRLRQHWFGLEELEAVVLAVHESVAAHFARAGVPGRSIRVLRNPVTPWRHARVAAERNRDVFYVGRLEEDKGVDLLAKAARRAGVPLQLIGDGALAAQLARAHPEARQHGWQSRERIAALIAGARVLVLPTRCRETFGLAALEALTSGIPVIFSKFAALAEEVSRNGFGHVVDPHDDVGFAALLTEIAGDDRQVEAMSRHAFAESWRLAPNPAAWCDQLLELYRGRLDPPGPPPAAAAARQLTFEEVR
jgi:glycosyltransferase involved in cell wall biosynthesis